MALDLGSLFVYILGLFLLYLACWAFIKPLKWTLRLLLHCVLGAVAVWTLNILGGRFGLHLALNPLTAMAAGVLGIPGMTLSLILASFL